MIEKNFDYFLDELISDIENQIIELKKSPDESEIINNIFRDLYTIKDS